MTRTISSWDSADVMPDTSESAAALAIGSTRRQPSLSFLSVLVLPDSDVTRSSAILSASSAANTFSCFDPVSSAGCFQVTK